MTFNSVIALGAVCVATVLGSLFVLHEWRLSQVKPIEVQIYATYPCTPNRFGSPEEATCAMYMGQEPISLFPLDTPLLFGPKGPVMVTEVHSDHGAWRAEARPGTYRVDLMFGGHFVLKSLTAGDIDLTKSDAVYTVPATGAPTAIDVVFIRGSTVQGMTTTNGKPAAARVFALGDGPLKSAMSVSANVKNEIYPFNYRLTDFPAGDYQFCAIAKADLDADKVDPFDLQALQNWCRKVKPLSLKEQQTLRLDLETVQ